jgi:hypothetical protein
MAKKNEDNFLTYVPEIKHKTYELKNGHIFLLFYHNKPVEKFLRWLVKKPNVSDIELDDVGSKVWELIDGKRNVYEIGQQLESELGEKCQPTYDRLVMYLRYLIRRGWVSIKKGE